MVSDGKLQAGNKKQENYQKIVNISSLCWRWKTINEIHTWQTEIPVLRTHLKVLNSISLKASKYTVQKRSKINYF